MSDFWNARYATEDYIFGTAPNVFLASQAGLIRPGMRVMDLEMRTWYGAPSYFVLGAVHAVAFWISVSIFSPLILIVCFFNQRRRLLHDMVVGAIVINNDVRASALRAGPPRT